MNPKLEQEAKTVLGVVSRAQNVFGGDTPPTEPPEFAAPSDLEDDLGKGYFGTTAATRSTGMTPRYRSVGDHDHTDTGGDDFANDFADRLILGGAWTWAHTGLGTPR